MTLYVIENHSDLTLF